MRKGKLKTLLAVMLAFVMLLTLPIGTLDAQAAGKKNVKKTVQTATVSGVTYKITSRKHKTATVFKSKASIKKAVVATTVEIDGTAYKVTSVSSGAFKKRTKLASVTLGGNIKTIGASAFEGDKQLKKIVIKSNKLSKISSKAFQGVSSKAVFHMNKSKYKSYKKLIVNSRVGWKRTMKLVSIPVTKVTVSGVTYRIANKKTRTAAAVSAKKTLKTAIIPATVKIDGKTYKVTAVGKNAFAGCNKLKRLTLGANITAVREGAFKDSALLDEVMVKSSKIKKFDLYSFDGKSTATMYVPEKVMSDYKVKLWSYATGWYGSIKSLEQKVKYDNVDKYTYSVIPLTKDVCSYFYVKTDNPDPESFYFKDEKTNMSSSGTAEMRLASDEFADVKYTNKKTKRVNGGYIFYCSSTDGGTLRLYKYQKAESYYEDAESEATKITVTIPKLVDSVDYLINRFTDSSMTFWEKMDAVQSGLDGICLYSGCYVLGQQKKSTTSPYYGLSTSPHVDQSFYIQNPYYREDSKYMLVSGLYPYRLDSLGFPSEMAAVATRLSAKASYKWSSYAHYLVDITYNGETHAYGGAGNGGGQGIKENQIKYKYTFDGTSGDAAKKTKLEDISSMISYYGRLTVPEDKKDLKELTWSDVSNTVGKNGAYVKLVLINSIFGFTSEGYTFFYKRDDLSFPGYFSNAWYDGRYFNSHEFFEKGTTFDDETASKASIVLKDVKIKFPEAPAGKRYVYNYGDIKNAYNYDSSTGVWKGYTYFNYDKDSDTWIASIYSASKCVDDNYNYTAIDDKEFKDACTLTREEVKAMNIDRNANTDPGSFYYYDMVDKPGTKNVKK